MTVAQKFSSKMDARVLRALRKYAQHSGRHLSAILTEAASDYLARAQVRPAFRQAMEDVLFEHQELLQRLAEDHPSAEDGS